jgi:putative sterol carrier protein
VPVFPSDEWAAAWLELSNTSAEFAASGRGFVGSVVLVVDAEPAAELATPIYLRLEGRDGRWTRHELGRSAALLDDALFVVRGPYARWKALIRQELHPIKALLQGKLRIEGHLPELLRWTRALIILASLAGEIETEFMDEARPAVSTAGNDGS